MGKGATWRSTSCPWSVEGRKRQATEAAITLLIAAFAVIVMIWGGSQLVLKTLASGQISPALRLPMGWVYGAVPVAGAIVTAYAAGNLLRIAQGEQILKPADEISVEMADPEESKR